MRLTFIVLAATLTACGGSSEELGTDLDDTSGDAVWNNGVDVGERWRTSATCDGAHIDVFDRYGYGYYKQIVVHDPRAAGYLKGKVRDAAEHDPFSGRIYGMEAGNRQGRDDEIVLYLIDSDDFT